MSGERERRALEVFTAFLRLGLTSFGGPIAHIGYFRRRLGRAATLGRARPAYAELVGLCQFLPGAREQPARVFSLGLLRGRLGRGLRGVPRLHAAFRARCSTVCGPPAPRHSAPRGARAGARAQAGRRSPWWPRRVLGMARSCVPMPRARHRRGGRGPRDSPPRARGCSSRVVALGAMAGLVAAARCMERPTRTSRFPRARIRRCAPRALRGAARGPSVRRRRLRFARRRGRGVLPRRGARLRRRPRGAAAAARHRGEAGMDPADDFLAGYGAAQAVPGPMFSLASYLGARLPGAGRGCRARRPRWSRSSCRDCCWCRGAAALAVDLVPRQRRARPRRGINAAVVGLLAAALYDPVWTGAVHSAADVAIALAGFALLVAWRASALWAVAWCVAASGVEALLSRGS